MLPLASNAQDSAAAKNGLALSAYAEVYYCYDFANPDNHTRPSFVYSHNRHNEVQINLAFVKAAYDHNRVRANLALAAGTYMNANYAAEPGVLQNLLEANAGLRLSKRSNLWLDAGILPSHLGFETPVGIDNWLLTRSMAADNSPYFETGARLSYTSASKRWYLAALYLNGWQRITRPPGNQTPAWGAQITYTPSENFTLNYSNFGGNDKPDTAKQYRWFNSLFASWTFSPKWSATLGMDVGMEQKPAGMNGHNTWYTPQLLVRFRPTEHISLAARMEYYSDPGEVIIATGTPQGFQTSSITGTLDWHITSFAWWRVELRGWQSRDAVFLKDGSMQQSNTAITTSICVRY